MRIGIGYDSHKLVEGRKLVIGGVTIPFKKGLLGHSDADVLCHAITDALIGALGLGDIGRHFPDTDEAWKDASSIDLLKRIVDLTYVNNYEISWIDSVLIAEKPKITPFIPDMQKTISSTGIPIGIISVKAKTNEGMGFIGRGQGIAAYAVCILRSVGQVT